MRKYTVIEIQYEEDEEILQKMIAWNTMVENAIYNEHIHL